MSEFDKIQTARELFNISLSDAKERLKIQRQTRKLYAQRRLLARNSPIADVTDRANQIGDVKDRIKSEQNLISFLEEKIKELGDL